MTDRKDENKDVDLPLDDAEVHQSPRYDDDAPGHDDDAPGDDYRPEAQQGQQPEDDYDEDMRADTEASPDYLAPPKRGVGVRRLNRIPLLVGGTLLLLAVGGVSYTYIERQNAAMAQNSVKKEKPPVKTNAAPPVRPSDADYIGIPAAGEALPGQAESRRAADAGMPSDGSAATQGTQNASPPPMSEAMQRRLRQIQQVEDKKLAKWDEALYGDTKTESYQDVSNPSGVAQNKQQGGGRVNAEEMMNRYLAANGMGGAGMGGAGMGGMGGFGGGSDGSMYAENRQDQKQAFLSGTTEANTYLQHQRKAAIAPSQEIKAGWVIPGVMISGINSDLPGQIIGQVREPVYDSATGTNCLIPAGARIVGTYDSGVTLGQSRALAVWNRLIYPDGSSISLDRMPGTDQSGYAGFYDKVNNHYLKIFGSGVVMSVFSAGIQLSQPQAANGENIGAAQTISAALGQQMGQIGMQMAQRNMNIQPTLEIRPGYQFNVMVTKDIILPNWEGHPMASASDRGCN